MLADALKDMRVVDLGQYIPGPFACLLLADLGAEVVKIEAPGGDPMRHFGPAGPDGVSSLYTAMNRNKAVVTLDLKDPQGLAHARDILQRSHVLVESFRPGALDRLGLGPEALRSLNPGLVHVQLSGFGQTGPWRQRAGHDLTYLALSGMLSQTGTESGPAIPFPPLADHAAALAAVIAVQTGLLRRLRTGRGARIDMSLYDTAMLMNSAGLTLAGQGLPVAPGEDLLSGGAGFYRCYRCADGRHMAVAPIESKFWSAFCAALSCPDLIDRHRDLLPQVDLIAELTRVFAQKTQAEWATIFESVDCCVEPVLRSTEAASTHHARDRKFLEKADFGLNELLLPFTLDGQPPVQRRALERESAEDVLARWPRIGR